MVEFEIWHDTENGTSCRANGSRKGDGVYQKMRSLGWNYSGRRGVFVIPASYGKKANTGKINFTVQQLRAAGYTVADPEIDNDGALSVAEQEQDRAARADQRAERRAELAKRRQTESDAAWTESRRITSGYGGEPVKLDHHSGGRHQRDLERAHNLLGKSVGLQEAADHHRRRGAAAAAQTGLRYSVQSIRERLEKIAAEQRGRLRDLAKAESAADPEWIEALREAIADGQEQETYWGAELRKAQAAGAHIWSRDDFAPGDFVVYSGQILEVVRVNPKSVSVPYPPLQHTSAVVFAAEGLWNTTVKYPGVKGRKTRAEVIALCREAGRPLPEGVTE